MMRSLIGEFRKKTKSFGRRFPLLGKLLCLLFYPSTKAFALLTQELGQKELCMGRAWHIRKGRLKNVILADLEPAEIRPLLGDSMEKICSNIVAGTELEGKVVFDIGASYGYYAILLSRYVGQSGRVYAFEPDWRSFGRLSRNIRLNRIPNVLPCAVAVSESEAGLLTWAGGVDEPWCNHLIEEPVVGEIQNIVVPTTNLDTFLRQAKITTKAVAFVKIDVEGSEGKVLRGGEFLFREAKPIVLCELHGEVVAQEVFAILNAYGYEWTNVEYITADRQHIIAYKQQDAGRVKSILEAAFKG